MKTALISFLGGFNFRLHYRFVSKLFKTHICKNNSFGSLRKRHYIYFDFSGMIVNGAYFQLSVVIE